MIWLLACFGTRVAFFKHKPHLMGFIFEQGVRTYSTKVDNAKGFSFDQTSFYSHIVMFSIFGRSFKMLARL